jgi:solute carrier family 39 (zinc transporter), member 1/2/3
VVSDRTQRDCGTNKMEMSTLSLKIIALVEIMISSLCGAGLPFLYIHIKKFDYQSLDREPLFFVLKSISCGVIIGVALIHLLPDGDEGLSEHYSYPVSFLMTGVGILLSLAMEQLTMWIVSTSPTTHTDHDHSNPNEHLLENDDLQSRFKSHERTLDYLSKPRATSTAEMIVTKRGHSVCEADMIVQVFADANDTKTLLKAYILECAIAVHSMIMGVSLGGMGSDEKGSIKVLMIAFSIHQFLEGISLGCAISAADLSASKVTGLIAFFACTLPIGIIIGIGITSEESLTSSVLEGVINSIAAGILIYVSMVEMMAEEFGNEVVRNNYLLKTKMIIGIGLGIAGMAVLAVWA